jgi:hypothetical protein
MSAFLEDMKARFEEYRMVEVKVEKAKSASATTVMLLPVATDVGWFHDCVLGHAEMRWIRGRIKFVGQRFNAPFASMIVIFRNMEMAR